ncbi:MAG: hypothetical protein ACRBBP_08755 [Bdellovibrionales bacterium]
MEIHDALPQNIESNEKLEFKEPVPSGLKTREFNLKTADLIKSQIGDIEEVRKGLGLSKRKMCQLLLIDPSTWTRWTTGKTVPPPYVYRMLQWGLAVMDKYPEVHPLVNYEKFEQSKKVEDLYNRLAVLEGNKAPNGELAPNGKLNSWLLIGLVSTNLLFVLYFALR